MTVMSPLELMINQLCECAAVVMNGKDSDWAGCTEIWAAVVERMFMVCDSYNNSNFGITSVGTQCWFMCYLLIFTKYLVLCISAGKQKTTEMVYCATAYSAA